MSPSAAADAFRTRVVTLTGLAQGKVVWEPLTDSEGKSMPRPAMPYLTIKRGSVLRFGMDGATLPDETTELVTRWGQRSRAMSLNYFGLTPGDGVDALETLLTDLDTEASVEALKAAGIGILSTSEVRDLAGLLDADSLDRAQLDVEISFLMTRTDEDQGIIENVSANLTGRRYPGDVSPITATIEVSDG